MNSKVTFYKNIRKDKIPYMVMWIIFYAWMLTFFTWWVNSFENIKFFDAKASFNAYLILLIYICITVFFVKPINFKKYIRNGGLGTLFVIIVYSFFPSKVFFYLFPFFIGMIFIGVVSFFIYVLNNTEKLYSLILGNLFIDFNVILYNYNILNIMDSYFWFVLIFLLSFVPLYWLDEKDYLDEEEKFACTAPDTSKKLYISLLINCIFLLSCRAIGRGFLLIANDLSSYDLFLFYYKGGLIGMFLLFLVYTYIKKSNSIIVNIIFAFYLFAFMLYFMFDLESVGKIFAFLLGICNFMGMVNVYYTLGVISKKHWDFKYTRCNILIIDILGCGVGALIAFGLYLSNNYTINVTLLIISIIINFIMLIVSPLLNITFFNQQWDEDSMMGNIDNLNMRAFNKYNLTHKEMLVCKYLMDNYTARQIAYTMNISENTVKFHKKKIFEKLKINSKDQISSKINN